MAKIENGQERQDAELRARFNTALDAVGYVRAELCAVLDLIAETYSAEGVLKGREYTGVNKSADEAVYLLGILREWSRSRGIWGRPPSEVFRGCSMIEAADDPSQ
ncbi:MAG: hypothetical protein KAJ19_25475 [Gammaproteobacteria bacterium]|nr:hypothetical protein [Gammaproteobacteria bacterium]